MASVAVYRANNRSDTPDQKKTLDEIHDSFRMLWELLDVKPVDTEALMLSEYPLDAAI